jgi:geranylgeranyl pyrophosphate synthase
MTLHGNNFKNNTAGYREWIDTYQPASERRIKDIKLKIHDRLSDFSVNDEHHPVLNEFIEAADSILLSNDAKRLRSLLPVLIADHCKLSENECLDYGIIVELLHYTSLIHDDVIDEDKYRRNHKTLNNIFANSQAVLIGDFIVCSAIDYCLTFTHSSIVIGQVVKAIKNLVTGIIIEQQLLPKDPTILRYQEMAELKTGSLFGLSFGLPFVGEDKFTDAFRCGEIFGTLFQINDDYFDRNDDDPGLNIFGIFPQQEIIAFWDKQLMDFMKYCERLDLEPMALILFRHLQGMGYFVETPTTDGVLFRLP